MALTKEIKIESDLFEQARLKFNDVMQKMLKSMKKSKSGEFSPHINKDVAEKLNLICGLSGENRTNYVSRVVEECIDRDLNNIRELIKGGMNNGSK